MSVKDKSFIPRLTGRMLRVHDVRELVVESMYRTTSELSRMLDKVEECVLEMLERLLKDIEFSLDVARSIVDRDLSEFTSDIKE